MNSITVPIIKETKSISGKKAKISKTNTPGNVKIEFSLWQLPVTKKIEGIEWDYKEGRSAGKAAAGAIIGGALTGGVGLIAGAAIGGKKNDVSTAMIYFADGEQLLVKLKAKEYETLSRWL